MPVALALLAVGKVVKSWQAAIALSSADAFQALALARLLLAELALIHCSSSVAVTHLATSVREAEETGGALIASSAGDAFAALTLTARGVTRAGDGTGLVTFARLCSIVEPRRN